MYFNLHDHLNAIRAGRHQRLWPRVIDEIPDPVGEELCPTSDLRFPTSV